MPALSLLAQLAERGELEIGEEVELGGFWVRRAMASSYVGEGDYCVERGGRCLWKDGSWRTDPWRCVISRARTPEDWPGWYDTLAEAVDHLYAALIQAGEV